VKLKVIWIIDALGAGGAERLTFSILEKFDRSKFDLRVCVLKVKRGNPIAIELEQIGIPVDLLLVPNLRHPANLPRLVRYLRAQKPDLIHTQLEFADILGNIAAKLLGIPCVSTLHTLDNPEEGKAHWRNIFKWTVLRYFCSRIIAVSESTRQHHLRFGKLETNKIITIYNGIVLSAFGELDSNEIREGRLSINLDPDSTVLVTVAVLRELKGIQYMIEAMELLVKHTPDLRYLIVGDGKYGDNLKDLARRKGLEKHILFAGQRSDIRMMLGISDVFVLPTLTEALPTVLMEAMAAKKAIVASEVGGVPEMVTDKVNGLLVPPADPSALATACITLMEDKALRERLAMAGYKTSQEHFNIFKQIATLEDLYQELTSSKGRNK
jgi:glycosyltransferase involved in cell wall biosynthesis